jgi:hypothetical protein
LQTIATDFEDVGFDVTLKQPGRVVYACKPKSLVRAITNIIDNATRFASKVEMELTKQSDGAVLISIRDDGPRLPRSFTSACSSRSSTMYLYFRTKLVGPASPHDNRLSRKNRRIAR